jgi:hypothetical protein
MSPYEAFWLWSLVVFVVGLLIGGTLVAYADDIKMRLWRTKWSLKGEK